MNKQKGLTLIELMIAMVIGLLVVGVTITLFVTNVRSATENARMTRLNQELRMTMGFISDELKRAGYSADPANSDFISEFRAVTNCIRYAYDENGNGIREVTERFGFELDTSTIRWGRSVTTNDCSDGNWESITNANTSTITAFTVTTPEADTAITTPSGLDILQFDVVITGQIDLNSGTASRTISETIRVRNEDPT
jgi:type IV pilus assembly protein PilW